MTGRREGTIVFPNQEHWAAGCHSAMKNFACDSGIDLPMRVVFAGVLRLNRDGHAPFDVGELRRLVAVVNRATGEMRLPHPSSLSRAIRTAVGRGWLLPHSQAQCLILPPGQWQNRKAPSQRCVHRVADRW